MTSDNLKSIIARHGVWLVTLFAFALRFAYLLYYRQLPEWDMLTVDNYYHHHWAQSIADGNIVGDTTYFRAPLYVWLLGALYSIAGTSLWVGRVLGICIGTASVGMTWMLSRRLFSPSVALIAACIHALYPIAIYHDGELLTDSLFTLILQIALYLTLRWFDTKQPKTALWAGLALGLSALARPNSLILAPLILLFAVWQLKNRKVILQQAVLFVCGAALVVSVTAIRNLIVAHDPVLIASQGGVNFYIGNNDEADGVSASMPKPLGNSWQMAEITYIAEHAAGHQLKPGEVSDYWFSQGMRWVVAHPASWFTQYTIKLYRQLANFEIPNQRDLNRFIANLPFPFDNPLCFGLLLPLAAWGIITGWRTNKGIRFLVGVVLLYMLATALFFVNSRFRLPILPIFFSLGAYGAFLLFHQVKSKSSRAVWGVGCVLAVGAFTFVPLVPLPEKINVQDALSQASFAITERNYTEAVTAARSAVERADTVMNTHLVLGVAYLRAGETDSAITNLLTEIRRFPANEKAYINLASAYLASGNPGEAISMANSALALAPYDITANQLLVRAYSRDSSISTDQLTTLCDTALQRTKYDAQVAIDIGAMLTERKAFAVAEEFLRRSLSAKPPAVETNDAAFERQFIHSRENMRKQKARLAFQLGFVIGLQGRYSESITYSRQAVDLDPSQPDAYINLISGYLALKSVPSADSVLRIAQQRFPTDQRLSKFTLPH